MFRKITEALRRAAGRGTSGRVRWDGKNQALHAEIDFVIEVAEDDVDGGFIVSCVNLPGCMSQGETIEEAFDNIGEAIGGVMACRFEREVWRQQSASITPGTAPQQLTVPVRIDQPVHHRPGVPA